MLSAIAKVIDWFRGWGPEHVRTAVELLQPPPRHVDPEPQPERVVGDYDGEQEGGVGAYTSLGTVLSDIEHTFAVLRKLRTVDPDAYAFNARVGGRILPRDPDRYFSVALCKRFLDELPAQGLVYPFDLVHEDHDLSTPAAGFKSAMYFCKVQRPPYVHASPGDVIYRMVVVEVAPSKTKTNRTRLMAVTYHVAIRGGVAVLLRETQLETMKVPRSRLYRGECNRGQTKVTIKRRDYPRQLRSMLRDSVARGYAVEDTAAFMFSMAANSWMASRKGEFHVRVTAGGVSAGFSVVRTVEFFRDRITGTAADGKRKRIFHSVSAHKREMADGKIRHVRAHYRGEREFSWNDYAVVITAPGIAHIDPLSFGGESVEVDDADEVARQGLLESGDAANKIMSLEGRNLRKC